MNKNLNSEFHNKNNKFKFIFLNVINDIIKLVLVN